MCYVPYVRQAIDGANGQTQTSRDSTIRDSKVSDDSSIKQGINSQVIAATFQGQELHSLQAPIYITLRHKVKVRTLSAKYFY